MLNECHKKLIEALKEKDETKGQEALKRHFMLINEILEERENRKYRSIKGKRLCQEAISQRIPSDRKPGIDERN